MGFKLMSEKTMQTPIANPPIGQMIDKETKLFGYIADMATASKIPRAFSKFCLENGDNASMVGMNIREDDLHFTLTGMKSSQIKGALLGNEYRKDALSAMDHITKEAEICGFIDACTVQEGKLIGHIATGNAIAALIKVKQTKKIAIYGAGSLAKSIVLNLEDSGFEEIVLFVDRVESAMELIEAVSPYVTKLKFDIERAIPGSSIDGSSYDVIINASSSGMLADDKVIKLENIKAKQIVDLAFNKQTTPSLFESMAKAGEASYIGGYDIIAQAAKLHYSIWFEKQPQVDFMIIERG